MGGLECGSHRPDEEESDAPVKGSKLPPILALVGGHWGTRDIAQVGELGGEDCHSFPDLSIQLTCPQPPPIQPCCFSPGFPQ